MTPHDYDGDGLIGNMSLTRYDPFDQKSEAWKANEEGDLDRHNSWARGMVNAYNAYANVELVTGEPSVATSATDGKIRSTAGEGVTIGFLDDGFDIYHPEISSRFSSSRVVTYQELVTYSEDRYRDVVQPLWTLLRGLGQRLGVIAKDIIKDGKRVFDVPYPDPTTPRHTRYTDGTAVAAAAVGTKNGIAPGANAVVLNTTNDNYNKER